MEHAPANTPALTGSEGSAGSNYMWGGGKPVKCKAEHKTMLSRC